MLSCVQSSNHCKDYSIYSPPFLMLEHRCLLMMKGLQGQGHLKEVQVPPKAMLQALGLEVLSILNWRNSIPMLRKGEAKILAQMMMILALAQVAMIQVVAETLDVLALQVLDLDVLALSLILMRHCLQLLQEFNKTVQHLLLQELEMLNFLHC